MTIVQPPPSRADEYAGPPKSWFVDEEWFRRDVEAVFRSRWLVAGHVDQIDANGKYGYLTFGIGDNDVVIRRGDDGELRAFHNVCPHRGARLCDADAGSAPNRRIVCPYHQWTFSADDGRLVGARQMHAGFDPTRYPLKQAQVQEWHGLVFVCFDDAPIESVAEYFAPGTLGGFDLSRMKLAATTSHEIEANWKVVIDNNNECYHCAVSHPELCKLIDWRFLGDETFDDGFSDARAGGLEVFNYTLPSPILSTTGKPSCDIPLPRQAGAPLEIDGTLQLAWEPGVVLLLSRDSAWMFVARPTGPETTQLHQYWFVHRDAVEGENYDVETVKSFSMTVMHQDKELCELVQQGLHNRAYEAGPLNRIHQQTNIAWFRWYETQIRSTYGAEV